MTKLTPHQRLSKWRSEQGLSLRVAGERLRCTGETVRRLEGGGFPGMTIAHSIRRVVGIPLMAWEKKP